ncbi:MAG: DUF2461 domain-containing protein [Bacteroidia bacterium]|nr:DUF2461 domain-containing protein [Bacteroidia bacterium]
MDFKLLMAFLTKLRKNNQKEWFDANRETYETLRQDWVKFTQEVINQSAAFDSDIKHLEAKKCIFRINRDVRFSKDKSPYKTNFGAWMNKGGKKAESAGYYLHLEPGNCFLAGGVYMPAPAQLQAIRQEIDYNYPRFLKIIKDKTFVKYFGSLSGDKLSQIPKGYDKDNPAIAYLKHKSFLMYHPIDEKQLKDSGFDKYTVRVFKSMKPMIDFLNEAG